jgi:hypothetical protein
MFKYQKTQGTTGKFDPEKRELFSIKFDEDTAILQIVGVS